MTQQTLPLDSWQDRIERRALEAMVEIRILVTKAMREIDRGLGLTQSFTNRSLGQRRRRARELAGRP